MNLKTSRIFRIFMMALDTFVLFLIRPFRKFTKLFTYENESSGALNIPHAVDATRPEVLGIKPELEVDGVLTEHFRGLTLSILTRKSHTASMRELSPSAAIISGVQPPMERRRWRKKSLKSSGR